MRRILHLVVVVLLALFVAPHGTALARATADHAELPDDDRASDLGVQPSARAGAIVSKANLPFPFTVRTEWCFGGRRSPVEVATSAAPVDRLVDQRSSIRRFRLRGHAPPGSADGPTV